MSQKLGPYAYPTLSPANLTNNIQKEKEIYMEYRSNVGLVLSKPAVNMLDNKLSAQPEYARASVNEFLGRTKDNILYVKQHEIDQSTYAELWYWEDIQWREDYVEIQFLENLMRRLDPDEYLFMRIGEETEDIEVNGLFKSNPFNMALNREIVFSGKEQ